MFVYTLVPGKIKALLAKIREVNKPQKVIRTWLESVGFNSSNDRTLMPVLSYLNFIDSSNVPTARWMEYRGQEPGKVLAGAIQKSYSELYDTYPDAHNRSLQEIEAVIKSKTTVGQDLVSRMTNTFKNLCAEADFSGGEEKVQKPKPPAPDSDHKELEHGKVGAPTGERGFPSLHIDIQVHITPDTSADQIDKIFESIAKHLPLSKT